MKTFFSDVIVTLIFVGFGLVSGFFIGKNSVIVEENTVVEYHALPTIHVSVEQRPLNVSIPAVPQFIFITDMVTRQQVIDTAAIIEDWLLQREYGGRLIEDSTGTIDYSAVVQYNQLQNISLDYTPFQRTVTATQAIRQRWAVTLGVGVGWAPQGLQPHVGITAGYVIWNR